MTKTIKLSAIIESAKLWEKDGKSRYYLNAEAVAKALGFTFDRYGTGSVKRAAYEGEKISNSEMTRVLSAISGYYDNVAKKFEADCFLAKIAEYGIQIEDDVNVEETEEPETPKEEVQHSEHGGKREGAGRKTTGHINVCIRLSEQQRALFNELGGSAFLRKVLDKAASGKLKI